MTEAIESRPVTALDGPICFECGITEARCAFNAGCCDQCTHFAEDDEADVTDSLDEAAILRAVEGDRTVPLTRDEVTEAWQRLERKRLPAHEIAAVLGTTTRSIQRWRDGDTERPYPRPAGGWPMTTPTIERNEPDLLVRARTSPSKAVQAAVRRVDAAIQRLKDTLAAEDEKARARREVERLERQLADARAKLRGGPGSKRPGVRGQPIDCPHCGRTCANPAGLNSHIRAAHEAA